MFFCHTSHWTSLIYYFSYVTLFWCWSFHSHDFVLKNMCKSRVCVSQQRRGWAACCSQYSPAPGTVCVPPQPGPGRTCCRARAGLRLAMHPGAPVADTPPRAGSHAHEGRAARGADCRPRPGRPVRPGEALPGCSAVHEAAGTELRSAAQGPGGQHCCHLWRKLVESSSENLRFLPK